MKRRFVQHLENTPEIKFECKGDKQLFNILELYLKIFQVHTIFFPWNLYSDQVKLIQSKFSNVRWVPLRQFPVNSIKFFNLGRNHMKDINNFFQFTMSQVLLAIQSILQNSNIFNRSRETFLLRPSVIKSDTIFRFSAHFSELPQMTAQYIGSAPYWKTLKR